MKKIELNIVKDILKSSMALHDFGIPVRNHLQKIIIHICEPTLLIINLREANPMDYEFVNISFELLINQYKADLNLYVVFKIDKWEFDELCTGIVDILKLKAQTTDLDDKNILIQNNFSLIYINEKNELNYLTTLSDNHISVLKEIESKNSIFSSEIQEKFSLIAEETTTILNDLIKCKFIYKIESPEPKYYSIKSLI